MFAHFTVFDNAGTIVARHETDRLIIASAMCRELAKRHPGCEIDIDFRAA